MDSILRVFPNSPKWKQKLALLRDMADKASTDQEADAIFGLAIEIASRAGNEAYAWDYFVAVPRIPVAQEAA